MPDGEMSYTQKRVMSLTHMHCDSFHAHNLRMSCVCDMTHSYVWRHLCTFAWHDSLMYVAWLIHMCAMTHTYVCSDMLMYVTWLIHVWHNSSICVTCWMLPYMWHDAFICVTWRISMRGTWIIHTCVPPYDPHPSHIYTHTYINIYVYV